MNKEFSSFLERGKSGRCYYYCARVVLYGYWEKEKWNESIAFTSTTADIFSWVCASSFLISSFVRHWQHLGQLWLRPEANTETIAKVLEMSRDGGRDGVSDPMPSGLDASARQRNPRWHRADAMCSRSLKLEFRVAARNCSIKALWCATIISTHQKRESKGSLMRVCCSAPLSRRSPAHSVIMEMECLYL